MPQQNPPVIPPVLYSLNTLKMLAPMWVRDNNIVKFMLYCGEILYYPIVAYKVWKRDIVQGHDTEPWDDRIVLFQILHPEKGFQTFMLHDTQIGPRVILCTTQALYEQHYGNHRLIDTVLEGFSQYSTNISSGVSIWNYEFTEETTYNYNVCNMLCGQQESGLNTHLTLFKNRNGDLLTASWVLFNEGVQRFCVGTSPEVHRRFLEMLDVFNITPPTESQEVIDTMKALVAIYDL